MLKNYLTITLRRLIRDRGYTLLNILGLTIGMACTILIGLYIRDELSYDRHHEKADRIYRMVTDRKARLPGLLGPFIRTQLPEVEHMVRFRPTFGAWLFAIQDNLLASDVPGGKARPEDGSAAAVYARKA